MQSVAVCCSVLQCVTVRCSVAWDNMYSHLNVLQCVAVCCSVLQYIAVRYSVLQCVAVCCSALQCVAESHEIICTAISIHINSSQFISIDWFWPLIFRTNLVRGPWNKEMKFQNKGAVLVQIAPLFIEVAPLFISQPHSQNLSIHLNSSQFTSRSTGSPYIFRRREWAWEIAAAETTEARGAVLRQFECGDIGVSLARRVRRENV